MTDHDALLRAICTYPDDDTPRLVFADYLDETGDAGRAAFIRAQIELARTPPWEPFAVRCRHRPGDWLTGQPWIRTLPPVDGWNLEWAAPVFRRGFGWQARVRSLLAWEQAAPDLLEQVPVGELHLPQSTLDQWRAFAAAEELRHLRVLHLPTSPAEPMLALRAAPAADGITDLHFHRASSPGLPFVIEELLAAPLGRSVRGLHLHVGYESLDDLIDALTPGGIHFERLTFAVMGLTPDTVRRWCERGGPVGVTELDLRDNPLGTDGIRELAHGLAGSEVATLGLSNTFSVPGGNPAANTIEALALCPALTSVRQLDLSRNTLSPKAMRVLSLARSLAELRSLDLAQCRIDDRGVRHLIRAKFWPNLVNLDLRGNPITAAGARHLLDAPIPPDLTALLLDGIVLGVDTRAALRHKFGGGVLFSG